MNGYTTINILDMIDAIGEDAVNRILFDFSCPQNGEIEEFVKKNAVELFILNAKTSQSCFHFIKMIITVSASLASDIRNRIRQNTYSC